MVDSENNNFEEDENSRELDDSFSLELDDFDLGEEELEPSALNDQSQELSDEFDDLVVSNSEDDEDDFLEIDLDSDLNLNDSDSESKKIPNPILNDEFLELELEDDIVDLESEIETFLSNRESVFETRARQRAEVMGNPIVSTKKIKSSHTEGEEDTELEALDEDELEFQEDLEDDLPSLHEDEEEGPLTLSMDELDNITGSEEEAVSEMEPSPRDEIEDLEEEFTPEVSEDLENDLGLDLGDSEVDTELGYHEDGSLDIDTEFEAETEAETPNPPPPSAEAIIDPEEEELFGNKVVDSNLTLSDDELGDILGSGGVSLEEALGEPEDEIPPPPPPTVEPMEESLPSLTEDDEEEGPITLSMDELDNISADAEEDSSDQIQEFGSSAEEEENVTLSDADLGDILGSDSLEEDESHKLEDEDGPISLSMEELDNISMDAETEEESEEVSPPSLVGNEENEDELVDSLDRAPLPYEEEEEESIALSMEELENITGEATESETDLADSDVEIVDSILGEELPGEDLADIGELPEESPAAFLKPDSTPIESEVDDEIELSDEDPSSEMDSTTLEEDLISNEDELITLGEETEPNQESETEEIVPSEEDLDLSPSKKSPSIQDNPDIPWTDIDLDEYALDGTLSPMEDLRASQAVLEAKDNLAKSEPKPEVSASGDDSALSEKDKKLVLTYLDNLLGNLPDQVIREFSKSQYFDIYKKMMKEMGL